MGQKLGRAVGVALLVAAVGGAPARAAGRAGQGQVGLLGEAQAWWGGLLAAWGLAPAGGLSAVSADEGHQIDPDGLAVDEGHEIDPNGAARTAPSGSAAVDEGHDIDPDGRH